MFDGSPTGPARSCGDARDEARSEGQRPIGTEHLLLALLADGDSLAARVLAEAGLRADDLRARVRRHTERGRRPRRRRRRRPARDRHRPGRHRDPIEESFGPDALREAAPAPRRRWGRRRYAGGTFSPRAKKVLELALREALRLRHRHIGTEHILLGVLREGQGLGALVLTEAGADLDDLRSRVEAALLGRPANRCGRAPSTLVRGVPTPGRSPGSLKPPRCCTLSPWMSETNRRPSGGDGGLRSAVVVNPVKVDDLDELRRTVNDDLAAPGWPEPQSVVRDHKSTTRAAARPSRPSKRVSIRGPRGRRRRHRDVPASARWSAPTWPSPRSPQCTGNLLAANLGLSTDLAAGVAGRRRAGPTAASTSAAVERQVLHRDGRHGLRRPDARSHQRDHQGPHPLARVRGGCRPAPRDRPMRLKIRIDDRPAAALPGSLGPRSPTWADSRAGSALLHRGRAGRRLARRRSAHPAQPAALVSRSAGR